ncbi:MAG: sodium:calcium antiporter [Alphaproteobacteria bacterium]|nr:MAG: sodium:calcium antiporter [Alphaproteobacteria bacterium]
MEFLSQTDVIILAIATLLLGMAILVKGGDLTINGAVEIARHYGMPPLLVGFTIVAFGTSLPELIASINANMNGMDGLAVGGMIGSNISNILLVGGVCAFITPLVANVKSLRNDMIMLAGVTAIWSYMIAYFEINMVIGCITIGLLIAYIFIQYTLSKNCEHTESEACEGPNMSKKKALTITFIGLICLAIGAELLIRGAVTTARIIGIRESVIGLTIVALGTSLPELTTCAMAAMKKQGDMVIGNIIGSNIFNLMMVLGGIAFVQPYEVFSDERSLIEQDAPIMLGATAAFILVLLFFKNIPRIIGGLFAFAYIAYIILLAYQSL